MQERKLLVTIKNELLLGRCELSLQEKRLVYTLIAKIKNKVAGRTSDEREFQELSCVETYSISAEEFANTWNLSIKNSYEILAEVGEKLFNRFIEVRTEKIGKGGKIWETGIKFRWVSSVKWDSEKKEIGVKWTPDIIPLISHLTRDFTTYKLLNLQDARSVHTMRLYEVLSIVQNLRQKELQFSLEELKYILGVGNEETWSMYGDFKRKILLPAMGYINTKTDIRVIMKEQKNGKKVTGVIFQVALQQRRASE